MKALALTAALVALAGPALPRAAGFDAPSYGDGCRGSCPNYYADADPSVGSGDDNYSYDFRSLVYNGPDNDGKRSAPSLQKWSWQNLHLADPARIMSTKTAVKKYGKAALKDHPAPWGYSVRISNGKSVLKPLPRPDMIKSLGRSPGGTKCGGCTAPSTYDYNRNLLPIRDGAPEPRLPCGDEILVWFPRLDVSSPKLYEWMEARPCGI